VSETTRVGRISQLDASVVARLDAACGFINDEVARVKGRVLLVGFLLCLTGALISLYMLQARVEEMWPFPAFVALSLAVSYWYKQKRELAKTFKHVVVRRVVSALGNSMTYSPESSFLASDFNEMDLFNKRAQRLGAEDEICGRKNAVGYTLLEAKATYEEGSGKNRRTVVLFKGLIVRLDFNKNFVGHTVVVPDADSRLLGVFGESESRGRKEIARMENVEFEKCFTVYCQDQQEARYLMTPKLMELFLEANAALGGKLRASFQHNHLYLTIPQSKDRFDISMFGPRVTPDTVVGDLTEVVGLAERLVDTLDLETRIWSRV
jgi:hypothetical protein